MEQAKPSAVNKAQIMTGSRVRCGVYVLNRWVPMHVGIVTRDYGDGTYDVDRMSLHGGAPWITRENCVRLEVSTQEKQP